MESFDETEMDFDKIKTTAEEAENPECSLYSPSAATSAWGGDDGDVYSR